MKTLVEFIKEASMNWAKDLEYAIGRKSIKDCIRLIKDNFGGKLVKYDLSLFNGEEDTNMTVIALSSKDPNYFLAATKESDEEDYLILYTEDNEIVPTLDITPTNYMTKDANVYVYHKYTKELSTLIKSYKSLSK